MASQTNSNFERLEGNWLNSSVEAVRPDSRIAWIVRRLKDGVGAINSQYSVEDLIATQGVAAKLEEFFSAAGAQPSLLVLRDNAPLNSKISGPPRLMFLYQRTENSLGDVDENSLPELMVSDGYNVRLRGKCMYFLRLNSQGVDRDTKNPELDMSYGEVLPDTLQCLHLTLNKIFHPSLESESQDWGKASDSEIKEYIEHLTRFNMMLADAASSMQGGIQLRKLEKKFMVENKQQAYIRASQDPDILAVYESVMEAWCAQCEQLLAESNESTESDDLSGPDTEFEFWRNRMAKFNSIAEQLKQKEHRCVIGVVAQNKNNLPSPTYKRWKAIDNLITDTLNEAKDNVKYLSALEKYTECLYSGSTLSIIEALPALISNTKMMLTIARYYGTSERMTKLFSKITNQMIVNCKNSINRPVLNGPIVRLWDQDISSLLDRLKSTLKLYEVYQSLYRNTKEKLALQPKGKQFDFPEGVIFDKFDQFCKRVQKLVSMFTTIQQFSSLAVSRIEGMEGLIQSFSDIMTEFKRKPYDLLDYTKNAFNRDYLEYTVNIAELEQQVQNFINRSFENIISTEQALALLRTFEKLLVRDVLRADLESKYDVIFQNYGQDLEAVQWLYEKYKASPPMVRNMPPVMGNILWAQQLLHRVEDPMRRFKSSTSLMQNSKDAKRIIKSYNKVARALIEFETLWHNAWMKSVEAARSGLQATLIIRHPRTNRLFVNFDREILQLIREAKGLQRVQVEIPENARMVLVHEDKLKSYFNQLSFALKEYDRVVSMIVPVVRPLLKTHLDDLEMKIQPGMMQLTWQSMNIDGYLQRIHNGLSNFEELVRKVNDIVEQRIDRNLKVVSKSLLVDLPSNQSFTLEQFVQLQEKATKIMTTRLDSKNREIEQAVNDVIQLIVSFPVETEQTVSQEEIDSFWKHHGKVMYLSVLRCTKQSFFALKNRLSSRTSRGLFWVERPFFDVDVELALPSVTMNPSLDEIQISINRCALNILRCSRRIFQWNKVTRDSPGEDNSYHYLIGQDYQIVAVCLMLTGAVDSVKKQVLDYLQTFMKYDFLWKSSKESAYSTFIRGVPVLEDFDQEMQKYKDIELKINEIPTVHNLGCLCLHTGPLKSALQREALAWKLLYGDNLHQQAHQQVISLVEYFKDVETRLDREISDLDLAQEMLSVLREVRDRETDMDMQILPIHTKYHLLLKHSIHIEEAELDQVFDLGAMWLRVTQKSRSRNDDLHRRQEFLWTDLNRSVIQFQQNVIAFREDFIVNGPMVDNLSPLEAAERMKKFKSLFQVFQNKWAKHVEGMVLFGKPIKTIPELKLTEQELELLDQLYSLYMNVLDSMNEYKLLRWSDYSSQMDYIETIMNGYRMRCNQMPRILREWQAYSELQDIIDDFLSVCPILRVLSGRAVRQRHWRSIQRMLVASPDIEMDALKLGDVLNMDLTDLRSEIEELCAAAVKELVVESKLEALKNDWAECKFEFQNFKNRGPVVLKATVLSDILEKCEESTATLGSMAGNRHSGPFRDVVQSWSFKLSSVCDLVEYLSVVQPLWIHMESVFSSAEIAKQLPLEAKRFVEIDKKYMKLISRAFEIPQVLECCNGNEDMRTTLPYLKGQLEMCQKSLTGYLESKRFSCPRLYFVSDKVLLELLCEGSELSTISFHLKDLFHSLAGLIFSPEQRNTVVSIVSEDGEEIALTRPIDCRGSVEEFLVDIEILMQSTVKHLIQDFSSEASNTSVQAIFDICPSQVCILSFQISMTYKSEEAIARGRNDKNIMPMTLKKISAAFKDLMAITLRNLGYAQRKCCEDLVTLQIYHKDAFEDLVKKKVKDVSDFDWQKQRRFYWNTDTDTWDGSRQTQEEQRRHSLVTHDSAPRPPGDCIMSIVDARLTHSYEFIGTKERLVITPMADRCVISLTLAIQMYLCGTPIGLPGTGKSELVKDLGNSIGKNVIIFTGSERMSGKDLIKFLKGLAMSGFWGLFDDFDRINGSLLSVAAHQIYCIVTAQREHRKEFNFADTQNMVLHHGCSLFFTTSQYDNAKTLMPESLKALLRCVSVTAPNIAFISRVKLAACGFEENAVIAKKIDALYALSRELLMNQQHDFGLRNVRVVLDSAAKVKRLYPERPERQIVAQALRDFNASKLSDQDSLIFFNLLADVFPGVLTEGFLFERKTKELNALQMAGEKLDLVVENSPSSASLFEKAIQLQEALVYRHSVGTVGPAGSGKSKIIDLLSKSLCTSTARHQILKIFPHCLTNQQLIGGIETSSKEWDDGIFPILWRKVIRTPGPTPWILFDGPIGPWVEILSTVLDSSKVLAVGNGDRLKLTSLMRIVFETDAIIDLSPATVARIGFTYVPSNTRSWETLVSSWLQTRRERQANVLRGIFHTALPELLASANFEKSTSMWSSSCQIKHFLTLFTILLDVSSTSGEYSDLQLARIALFATCWSIGAVNDEDGRKMFDVLIRKLFEFECHPPSEAICHNYFIKNGEWASWRTMLEQWKYPDDLAGKISTLVVSTVESVQVSHILQLLVPQEVPCILTGGPGVGKTLLAGHCLAHFKRSGYTSRVRQFSYATSPKTFQNSVEGEIERRQGHTYGPLDNSKRVFFIDDMHLPAANPTGLQVNELVRQLLQEKGMYDQLRTGEWKHIVDHSFVSSVTTQRSSNHVISEISSRLSRQFMCVHVITPNRATLEATFGTVFRSHFSNEQMGNEIGSMTNKLLDATIGLWDRICRRFETKASDTFHYNFTCRDLFKVIQGMLKCDRDSIANRDYMLRLWIHECERVFTDSLFTAEDQDFVHVNIIQLLEDAKLLGYLRPNTTVKASDSVPKESPRISRTAGSHQGRGHHKSFSFDSGSSVHFWKILREAELDENGDCINEKRSTYELAIGGMEAIRQKIFDFATTGSESNIDTVLFPYALEQILKILRIITTNGGHCLLMGGAGTGKQKLTRISALIARQPVVALISAGFWTPVGVEAQIKHICRLIAVENKDVTCLVANSHFDNQGLLDYISPLFSLGQLSDLISREVFEDLMQAFEEVTTAAETPALSKSGLCELLLDKVRNGLHVVFCYSPADEIMNTLNHFPILTKCCQVVSFLEWSNEMMQEVARFKLDEIRIDGVDFKARVESLPTFMMTIYNAVKKIAKQSDGSLQRSTSVTTQTYLDLLCHFGEFCVSESNSIVELTDQLDFGLEALRSANEDIAMLQTEIEESELILNDSQKLTVDMLKNISTRSMADDKKRAELQAMQAILKEKVRVIELAKDEIQQELLTANPSIAEANSALQHINPKDLQALKGLKNPPVPLKAVLDGLLILQHKPLCKIQIVEEKGHMHYKDSFTSAAATIFEPGFVEDLLSFRKECLTDESIELLQPYLEGPFFNAEALKKISGVGTGLCLWMMAILAHYEIFRSLRPKLSALSKKEEDYRLYEKVVASVSAQVQQAQEEVDCMQSQLVQAIEEKKRMQDDLDLTNRKLQAAKALIVALSEQESRWKERAALCETRSAKLIGDCAIAAIFLTFCGPLTKALRETVILESTLGLEGRKIDFTANLNITDMFVEMNERTMWKAHCIAVNELSIQNIILTRRAIRWPLLIDPQGQGLQWILMHEKGNEVKHIFGDKHLRETAEECMTVGKPLIIEDVGQGLERALFSVVPKRVLHSRKEECLKFSLENGKEIECDSNFRLYITSRIPSTKFSVEVSVRVAVVDFTLNTEGLNEQILGYVVQSERPDLFVQRQSILMEVSMTEKKIKGQEEDILLKLCSSNGSILNDSTLIEFLGTATRSVSEAKESLKRAQEAANSILKACEEFRKIAELGGILYALSVDMAFVDSVYSTSLLLFVEFFKLAMESTSKDATSVKKINTILEDLTLSTSKFVLRGLLEKDRELYLLLLAFRTQIANGQATKEQLDCFVNGGSALVMDLVRRKPYNWIPDSTWLICAQSSMTIPQLKELPDSVQRLGDQWRVWCDAETPETLPFPDIASVPASKMERMNKLILVRAFRMDRMRYAARQYISEVLGDKYLLPVGVSIETSFASSSPKIPLLCILTPGADPNEVISVLAKKLKKLVRFISTGHDQESTARRHLDTAISLGNWIVLENAHVNPSFLTEIEHHLKGMTSIEADFRLWLTACPQKDLPMGLLQMSIKVSLERPTGIRAYIEHCEACFGADFEETSTWQYKSLVLALSLFHSTMRERGQYGALGWSVPYESHHSEFQSCAKILQNIGESDSKRLRDSHWYKLKYMIAEVEISGQITDEWDRRVVLAYADSFLNPAVLEPNHIIFKDISIPSQGDVNQSFRQAIERLAGIEDPESIGLHAGAGFARKLQGAQSTLDCLAQIIQPEVGSAGRRTSLHEASEAMLLDLRDKLPPLFNKTDVKACLAKEGGPQAPLNITLQQEIDFMDLVLQNSMSTLKSLKDGDPGAIGVDHAERVQSLLANKVPSQWATMFWTGSTVAAWFTTLLLRYDQLRKWIDKGRPYAFWLGGFCRPGAIIAAMRQEVARKYQGSQGWTVEDTVIFTEVSKMEIADIKVAPEDGLYVHGLFLHGCSWSKKESRLTDLTGKGLTSPLPVLYISFVHRNVLKYEYPVFECPLAVIKTTGVGPSPAPVCVISLKSEENITKWILRGVLATCLRE